VGEGVLVINVPQGSRLGLKPGDVVLSVDGREPAGPSHLVRILRSYNGRESFTLQVVRQQKRKTITGQVAE
ncbi:MAG TPA: PDZ domain-containing protein, partial [Gemmatimonadales bacterium]|nr:PDZ domain-containing protein [Gemmatimonadales bacterium]